MAAKRKKELRLKGVISSPGIAIAECFIHKEASLQIRKRAVPQSNVDNEVVRLDAAVQDAKCELERVRLESEGILGAQVSKIFEAELLIFEDMAFFKQVCGDIRRRRLNAEYVYKRHVDETLDSLKSADDQFLREMANDVEAASSRVLHHLIGSSSRKLKYNKRKIALAPTFTPGEIVLMNKYRIPGFAATKGGPTSHMVLVARSLSIPAVVGINKLLNRCDNGAMVIVDGDNSVVIVNPTDDTLATYKARRRKGRGLLARRLRKVSKLPEATRDGRAVEVLANVDYPSPTDQLLASSKTAVGLYRTEFFYLSSNTFPSEDQQARIYSEVARTFYPKSVTMRVFDLGSDKVKDDRQLEVEHNPALGWRGIRFDLEHSDYFMAQVKALLRASELGNLKIMLPMVSSAMEVVRAKRTIRAAMKELRLAGIKFDDDIEVGIMIEVPSAALMADSLARHVNFFSIGTNDLVQYTLAVDRSNKSLAKLYRELHPAVLRLIEMTINAAIRHGIDISMCGELAGNLQAVPLLIGLGLQRFSVNPFSVPQVKRTVAAVSYGDCKDLAARVMSLPTTEKVEAVLRDWYHEHFED